MTTNLDGSESKATISGISEMKKRRRCAKDLEVTTMVAERKRISPRDNIT